MKAYVKKNLVENGNGKFIAPGMKTLEGTIIDVVWDARGAWRGEASPYWLWEDEWLMILPDGYDLAKAVGVNIEWYDSYVKQAIEINKLKEDINNKDNKISSLNNLADQLMDSIAQKDAILFNIKDRIIAYYDSHVMV